MVVYHATEKDCGGENGEGEVECVICFEEFAVGDEMGRLECLCKFHKVCWTTFFTHVIEIKEQTMTISRHVFGSGGIRRAQVLVLCISSRRKLERSEANLVSACIGWIDIDWDTVTMMMMMILVHAARRYGIHSVCGSGHSVGFCCHEDIRSCLGASLWKFHSTAERDRKYRRDRNGPPNIPAPPASLTQSR